MTIYTNELSDENTTVSKDKPTRIWADPLGRYIPVSGVVLLIVGAILQVVDTWLVKKVMDVLLDDSETMSLIVACAIGLGGFVAAVGAGIAIRARNRWWGIGAGGSWLALGLTVLALRWQMAAIVDDGVQTPTKDHALGGLMLALFVAAGVTLMYDMQKLYNRARGQIRTANWRISYYDRRLRAVEPVSARLQREVALRGVKVTAIEQHFFDRKADNVEFAAELRDLSRVEILRQLGDESESGVVHMPHRSRAETQVK